MRFLVAAVLILAAAPHAYAQAGPCGPRADLLKQLAGKHREAPLGIGPTNNRTVLELVASADGATWTLVEHYVTGQSCALRAGTDWQPLRWEALACRDNPDCA